MRAEQANKIAQTTELPIHQTTTPHDLTFHIRAEPLKYSFGYTFGSTEVVWIATLPSKWLAWAPTDWFVFSGASWAIFASGGGEPWGLKGTTVGFKQVREEYDEENIPDYDIW